MDNIYTLITGTSSGIGKEMAFHCASRGMNILNIALPDSGVDKTNNTIIKEYGVKSHFLELDLADNDGPEKVFRWVTENDFQVNFLINNAGMAGTSVFEKSSYKYLNDRIMVNIRALVLLSHLFIPVLKKHEKSYILNVGSLSAFFPIPYKSVYAASKSFVLNFSRALRTELQGSNISISVICPNGVRTNVGTNQRIDAHGKKGQFTSMPASTVAKTGVDKTLKGKFLIIPGKINYLLFLTSKIIPQGIQEKILKREFEKEVLVS